MVAGSFFIVCGCSNELIGGLMKKFSKKFARDLIFPLSRDLPLEGQKLSPVL